MISNNFFKHLARDCDNTKNVFFDFVFKKKLPDDVRIIFVYTDSFCSGVILFWLINFTQIENEVSNSIISCTSFCLYVQIVHILYVMLATFLCENISPNHAEAS